MQVPITVLIPTFKEENLIAQAINCAKFADEVLIIDSYSTDATVEIAERLNCTILKRKFDNFSNQKNFAISKAKNDWILVLDADEYLTYELRKEIVSTIQDPRHIAYKMPFKNYFLNRFIHFGGNGNKIKLRLFNRKSCKYEGLVHEELICEGSIGVLSGRILHYTYKNLWHFFQKKNHYAQLQAEQLFRKGKTTGSFQLIFKPAYRFLSEYFFRLGFLDGVAGLTSTSMNAYGVLSRYVKLLILKDQIKDPLLKTYVTHTRTLMEEAKTDAYSREKIRGIYKISFFWKPFQAFWEELLIHGNIKQGKEGYILSYLAGFKAYNTVLYQWLRKRNLD